MKLNKKSGFTLVEVIAAILIMIIAIIGTSSFFYANRRNLVRSEILRLGTWSAVEKMEELKSMDYNELEEGSVIEEVSFKDGKITTSRTTSITEQNENGVIYKKVEVWVEREGEDIYLVTYIAQ